MRSFDEYGKLSKQRIDELEEGVRVDAEPGKADPLDFAVWKAAKPGEPAWDSPWGMGRPGWHIECSAMGLRYLGAGFDVHGGGRDLIFPHHENEIAQSEAAGLPFAKVWMHNGMIRSEGEKMAKSVGNIFLLREVLDRYEPAVGAHLLPHDALPQPARVQHRQAGRGEGRLRPLRRAPSPTSTSASPTPARRRRAASARTSRCARRPPAWPSPSAWTTTSTPPAPSASCSRWSARCTATSPQVDRGEAPLDTEALTAVGDVLRESLGVLLIPVPGAGAGLTGVGSVAGDDAAACVTGGVALLPAARLAEEGRWDDVALVYADRLGCDDASYACVLRDHYRAEKQWADADRLRDELQAAGFEVRDTPQGTQVVKK